MAAGNSLGLQQVLKMRLSDIKSLRFQFCLDSDRWRGEYFKNQERGGNIQPHYLKQTIIANMQSYYFKLLNSLRTLRGEGLRSSAVGHLHNFQRHCKCCFSVVSSHTICLHEISFHYQSKAGFQQESWISISEVSDIMIEWNSVLNFVFDQNVFGILEMLTAFICVSFGLLVKFSLYIKLHEQKYTITGFSPCHSVAAAVGGLRCLGGGCPHHQVSGWVVGVPTTRLVLEIFCFF